jgi:DNA repair photolyase
MPLNKATGNMYPFIDYTWNVIKGKCPHDCSYCYMKRWGKQGPLHFDKKELETDLGSGNFIFVGSSCDMFAPGVERDWIIKTLQKTREHDNKYLFQTKNTEALRCFLGYMPEKLVLATTLETNRHYPKIMGQAPAPFERAMSFAALNDETPVEKHITAEPLCDFDLDEFVCLIRECRPLQVNIGADSGNNHLPEPSPEKIAALVRELRKFAHVHLKKNLGRLYKEGSP